ncbi:MAG: DUF4325 domain-containing protein [Candidatus Falkowbacteria bacterium]|jgi:hypothetical protein|nr:DUF4325 domain-containing protein [Candidatus Falkowbacteria bacterium]
MILEMKKFGNILNSRPAASEAVLRVKQIINGSEDKEITLDFCNVEVLTPSFADEFAKGLKKLYPNEQIRYQGYENNKIVKDVLEKLSIL